MTWKSDLGSQTAGMEWSGQGIIERAPTLSQMHGDLAYFLITNRPKENGSWFSGRQVDPTKSHLYYVLDYFYLF